MQQRSIRAGHVSETFWIAGGGALGALARHGIDAGVWPVSPGNVSFPWATLAINTAGSFVLGWVLAWSATRSGAPDWVRPFVGVGFCGAFTTFSTLTVELVSFAWSGAVAMALVYLAASLLLGILAAAAGERVATRGSHG